MSSKSEVDEEDAYLIASEKKRLKADSDVALPSNHTNANGDEGAAKFLEWCASVNIVIDQDKVRTPPRLFFYKIIKKKNFEKSLKFFY